MSTFRGPDGSRWNVPAGRESAAVASGMVPDPTSAAVAESTRQANPGTALAVLPKPNALTGSPSDAFAPEATRQTRMGKAPLDLGADLFGLVRYGAPIAGGLAGGEVAAALFPEKLGPLLALLKLAVKSVGSGAGAGAATMATGGSPEDAGYNALWQGGLTPASEAISALLGSGAKEFNRAALSPEKGTVKNFRNVLDAFGKSGVGLDEGKSGAAISAAAKAERALYGKVDKTGWTMTADQLAPDPESLVPNPRTPDRPRIIKALQKEIDKFTAANGGQLKASDIADIAKAHRQLSSDVLNAESAGKNPGETQLLSQLHRQIYGNAKAALENRLLPPTGEIGPAYGGQIAKARAATKNAIGVDRAVTNAATLKDQGSPAIVKLRIPGFPQAAWPAVPMGRDYAALMGQILGSPITGRTLATSPRMVPNLLQEPDSTGAAQ